MMRMSLSAVILACCAASAYAQQQPPALNSAACSTEKWLFCAVPLVLPQGPSSSDYPEDKIITVDVRSKLQARTSLWNGILEDQRLTLRKKQLTYSWFVEYLKQHPIECEPY